MRPSRAFPSRQRKLSIKVRQPWARQTSKRSSAHGNNHEKKSPGVFILGMHRSGTSVLARLLAERHGFAVTGQHHADSNHSSSSSSILIGGRFANTQGYYERTDVVWQNEHWLEQMKGLSAFHHVKRLQQELMALDNDHPVLALDGNGTQAMDFIYSSQQPWLVKDPRISLTLPFWLHHWRRQRRPKSMSSKQTISESQKSASADPAIVLIYRHPMEVAWSLRDRDNCEYDRAIGLWIVYNQLALRHSAHTCRLLVSNKELRLRPLETVGELVERLVQQCHMLRPTIHETKPLAFDSPPLLRRSRFLPDCSLDYMDQHKPLKIHWKELNLSTTTSVASGGPAATTTTFLVDKKRVRQAMQLYCDLQSGRALQADYVNGKEWAMLERV